MVGFIRQILMRIRHRVASTTSDIRSLSLPPHAQRDPPVQAFSPNMLMPYDENLLERSRVQWQFGDWESLAGVDSDSLRHHPDRARIALFAASGHQQLNNVSQARALIHLAKDWGCNKRQMACFLIADAENTIGRAALSAGDFDRGLSYFTRSIATGLPGTDSSLLGRARMHAQLKEFQAPASAGPTSQSGGLIYENNSASRTCELEAAYSELHLRLQKQAKEITSLKENLKKEIQLSNKRVESLLKIQGYLGGHIPLPTLHGWPISPDLAVFLLQTIEKTHYDIVIEFGSGASTLLISHALRNQRRSSPGRETAFISFDHLEEYFDKTLLLLKDNGVDQEVELILAPLLPLLGRDGVTYPYYDCLPALATLSSKFAGKKERILVLVDGPPGSTTKHARYPALGVLLKTFPNNPIDMILDDFDRAEEEQVVKKWQEDLNNADRDWSAKGLAVEKGACFLTIASS